MISILQGLTLLNLLFYKKSGLSFLSMLCLAIGLGLGVSGELTFLSFLYLRQFNPVFVLVIQVGLLLILLSLTWYRRQKYNYPFWTLPTPTKMDFFYLLFLVILGIPLYLAIYFHPYGGWDAWSVWNLKAKFLFQGGVRWENMFHPSLWRSSPHYPILLPLINVWGWTLLPHPSHQTTQMTTILFNLATLGILFSSLKDLTRSTLGLLPVMILAVQPYFQTLSSAQYADIVLGYYLLTAILCFVLGLRLENNNYFMISAVFLGLLSFTKPEGNVCAVIILLLSIGLIAYQKSAIKDKKKVLKAMILCFLIFSIIPVIFKAFYTPSNMTFHNGLISQTKPSQWMRLKVILAFYSFQLFTKGTQGWNGVFLFLLIILIMNGKKIFRRETLIIPLFLIVYLMIVSAYYYVNTHFEISWWLKVSLSRIELASSRPLLLVLLFFVDPNAE